MNDFLIHLLEELLQLIGFAGGLTIETKELLGLSQLVEIDPIVVIDIAITSLFFSQPQNGADLRSQLTQTSEISLRTWLLCTELQHRRTAKHPCRSRWILFAGELKHQLGITNGLKRRLGYTKTIDTALQHRFHRLHFLGAHTGNVPGRLHLHGELTTPA